MLLLLLGLLGLFLVGFIRGVGSWMFCGIVGVFVVGGFLLWLVLRSVS
jgi:hypothetical protein